MTPVPDPRFRDQLAEALDPIRLLHAAAPHNPRAGDVGLCVIDGEEWPCKTYSACDEVEARVQAAANQRAAEELPQPIEGFFAPNGEQMTAVPFRARAAALASPAPTPRAEEDVCVHGHATDDAHVCGAPR